MSSQADPSGHSTGALTWPAKSSAQGNKNKNVSICMMRVSSANYNMSQTTIWVTVKYLKPRLIRCMLTGSCTGPTMGIIIRKNKIIINNGNKKCSNN